MSHQQTKAGASEQSKRQTLTCGFRKTDDVVKANRQNRQAKELCHFQADLKGGSGGRNFDADTDTEGRGAIRATWAHGHDGHSNSQVQMSVSLVHLISLLPYPTLLAQPLPYCVTNQQRQHYVGLFSSL